MVQADGLPAAEAKSGPPLLGRRGFLGMAVALSGSVALGVSHSSPGFKPLKGDLPVNPRLFSFLGGNIGDWSVESVKAIVGDNLPEVKRVQIVNRSIVDLPEGTQWILRGATSNERYVTRPEKETLVKKQAALGRPTATHAALIPIRKNAKWWALTQDERRAIFEEKSRHISVGLKYLPAIARRLHHCRDLNESEPFDFLTLFDFTKADIPAFDDMLAELRAAEEWKFVDREVDIRLVRAK